MPSPRNKFEIQWPLFLFLDLLFENEALGYNGIIVNNSNTMNAVKLKLVYRHSERNRSCTYFCHQGECVTMATNVSVSNSVI